MHHTTFAQFSTEQVDLTITAGEKNLVIDTIIQNINQSNVFPGITIRLEKAIRENQKKRAYNKIERFLQKKTKVEHNYGFDKVDILDGDIGYVDILGFFPFDEATGGGANFGDLVRIDDHFLMNLPIGRPISPVTRTN